MTKPMKELTEGEKLLRKMNIGFTVFLYGTLAIMSATFFSILTIMIFKK